MEVEKVVEQLLEIKEKFPNFTREEVIAIMDLKLKMEELARR